MFFFRRIMWLKQPNEPIPLAFGKAFHTALELFEKEGANPVRVFMREFTHSLVPHITAEKFSEERAEGIRLLQYWIDNNARIKKEEGIEITEHEVPFKLKITRDPLNGSLLNLPSVNGYVDFVTKDGSIGDYKTSKKKFHQSDVDESDQPTFYYLWHLIERGTLPESFIYIVYRKGIKRVPYQVLRTHRTIEQISELLRNIQSMVLDVEAKRYIERHNDSVRFCDCSMYEEMLRV